MIAFFGGQPRTLRQVLGLGARSTHYQVLLSPSGCIRHRAIMILLAGSPVRAPSESPEGDYDRAIHTAQAGICKTLQFLLCVRTHGGFSHHSGFLRQPTLTVKQGLAAVFVRQLGVAASALMYV